MAKTARGNFDHGKCACVGIGSKAENSGPEMRTTVMGRKVKSSTAPDSRKRAVN